MHFFSAIVLTCLASTAVAYPALEQAASSAEFKEYQKQEKRQTLGFDAASQIVSTTGDHAWQAPGANDIRGPCPGLNSMANHGYIPRNGYTSDAQIIAAMQAVFNISPDFGGFLTVLGSAMGGDGLGFSIGGPPSASLLTATGLVGKPQGMSNTHNRFESDQSITRDDLYQTGNDVTLNMNFFQDLLNSSLPKGWYDIDVLGNHAVKRFQYSVANNPYFFKGLNTAFIPEATSALVTYLFANHSAACPAGCLDATNLKSFYSVTGSGSTLKYTPGHERIPDNWYKYPVGYGVANVFADMVTVYSKYSNQAAFGGNTGTVNSFTGLDVANITGGVYNAETLLQGNNLGCFLFNGMEFFMPDLISNGGVIGDVSGVVSSLTGTITSLLAPFNCPKLSGIDKKAFAIYPGWNDGKPRK
ncbi:chloroperoxidase-like protein [Dothistroma septosporum NZE10]|uniref:Dothistromin biosynthesis peroxidase dotB n=2 Tax=Dothistroma septosporum TaxID=64363 RepID=DOTB_DOTSN|nr:RecName: Full=Dothistromin biosynthesis peroxidase dotB; AltName: Full=Dothistromin biosynthesis protein B; Flags: Precursor [Dothistroma septosporum NZE10]Q8TFD4.1 RecName: Full=Dothistromin biosynthesis peroxidase dotB; AltName: Full=Dothistromin biosynthesis protein B; Flags: Precursor [Dothistroma septosporum]AAL87046.1 putative oxidase [Dothistroma septosporum]EME38644.1 chloroperoxidase-like protein [Dothistroma septosporum NZE10]